MPFCGLDVSLRTTSLCIVDQDGRVLREAKLPSDPIAIGEFLDGCGLRCERIGLESGSTSSWLCAGLRGLGHAVICIEARHAAAALQAGPRNKTDRNDARGLAQLIRLNAFREVWLKSPESHRRGLLLTARGTLQGRRVALENTTRGPLRTEGIVFPTRGTRFTEHVLGRVGDSELLLAIIRPLLEARTKIVRQLGGWIARSSRPLAGTACADC